MSDCDSLKVHSITPDTYEDLWAAMPVCTGIPTGNLVGQCWLAVAVVLIPVCGRLVGKTVQGN